MNEQLLILGMLAATFVSRYPLLVLVGRVELPKRVFRALRYVPVAVLTAISVPPVLLPDGQFSVSFENPYLIGGIVAIVIAWRSKNLLLTIVVGMAVFLAWRALNPV